MSRLRLGILGCARIVRRDFAGAAAEAPSVELAGLASRNVEKAAAWAKEYGISKHFGSYEALLADPDIDAVYLPLPNEMHRTWALRAAECGKHVLCEKPLGLDYADAKIIADGCREQGVMLMEAFMWRHHPRVALAKKIITAGDIGELRLVKMDFSFPIDDGDWRLDPQRGGGALYDLGCYAINAARLFTGNEPLEAHAAARMQHGVDMTVGATVQFPDDTAAVFDCSFECPERNRLEIVGTHGVLELPGGVLPSENAELVVFNRQAERKTITPEPANQYAGEMEAFAAAVRTGTLPAPAEDGLLNMKALEMVHQAAHAKVSV
ncbi:MAG: Gfo/Idh/MocA family oxidoreductase [Planctomycetales bacterium]